MHASILSMLGKYERNQYKVNDIKLSEAMRDSSSKGREGMLTDHESP